MLITETVLHNRVQNNKKEAQVKIVELVSRLIDASCPGADWKRIPLGDATNEPGMDGFLVANTPHNLYVPE
jgi:hypothetical protein